MKIKNHATQQQKDLHKAHEAHMRENLGLRGLHLSHCHLAQRLQSGVESVRKGILIRMHYFTRRD
jgi:MOSC domain-containing protein YiiM